MANAAKARSSAPGPLRGLTAISGRLRKLCSPVGIAVLVLAAVAVAVSSGGGDSAAASKPIVVGGVYSAAENAGANVGAEAAFKSFNDAGGLQGRKITYVGTENDSSDPTTDIAATKTLINQGVMAIVPVVTFGWSSAAVAAAAHVPYFGYSVTAAWDRSANGFSYIGTNSATGSPKVLNTAAIDCQVVPGGCKGKAVSFVTLNAASSIQIAQITAHQFQQLGAKVVSVSNAVPTPPAVVSDYSPYANALLDSNKGKAPDIIFTAETTQDDSGLWTQLKQLGYKGTFFNYELYNAASVAVATGSYTQQAGQFLYTSSAPQAVAMRKAITAFDPSFDQHTAAWTSVENGYLSAEMFISAIKRVGPSVTGTSLIAILNKGWTWAGIPNLAGSVQFPQSHQSSAGCLTVLSSDGKAFHTSVPLVCNQLVANPLYQPGASG
jgi:branched-chain amino acid transport system substrate-binding protein